MSTTSVTKSLNFALIVYYQFLAHGQVPKVPTIGTIPDEKWSSFLSAIEGRELTRFKVLEGPVLRKEHPGLVRIWKRAQAVKSIEFFVDNVNFIITMHKDEKTNQWLFHSLKWGRSFPAYTGATIKAG